MKKELVGKKAPDFSLPDSKGELHSLSEFAGSLIVLYFYPKDDTPGCTREACDFRDRETDFADANAVVIGISKDTAASHKKFARKYNLPFLLLSDPDHQAAEKFGAYGEKKLYGKTTMGTIRSTFLIDRAGKVAKQWNGVKVGGHADAVLKAIEEIS